MNYQQYYESIRKSIVDYLEDPGISYLSVDELYCNYIEEPSIHADSISAYELYVSKLINEDYEMEVSGVYSLQTYNTKVENTLTIAGDDPDDAMSEDTISISNGSIYYVGYDSSLAEHVKYRYYFPNKNGTLAVYSDTIYYSHMVGLT